ncbi:hypothetical protein H696_00829 [Fonticula alba]|uniref:Exportin-1/Importin-beta-like domain-containing protein n=1 Tax=Fonticula alba TaxID=691883 RepID=A0A058ZH73_FONAL|nr:hypothetical protein H696_00829 [Fonticula alba]KCV73288.1 hypothetical protein H696_00829 [Fonticula alba]|eukprot:XP_009492989.1 hypothetical protein H696_00829 [Fonticula alba]
MTMKQQWFNEALSRLYIPLTNGYTSPGLLEELMGFCATPNVWQLAIQAFDMPSDPKAQYFAIFIIGRVVARNWRDLSDADRTTIWCFCRDTLFRHIQAVSAQPDAMDAGLPRFIVTKLTQLCVDMGKHNLTIGFDSLFQLATCFLTNRPNLADAPQSIDQALSLLDPACGSPAQLLGLAMLLMICEECTSVKDDLPSHLRNSMRKLLYDNATAIMNLVLRVLDSTHEQARIACQSDGTARGNARLRFPPMIARCVAQALTVVSQLLSWVPLNEFVDRRLVQSLFQYVVLHVDSTSAELGAQALECVNEILGRSCIPRDLDGFLVQIFGDVFRLLQSLTADPAGAPSPEVIRALDSQYRERLTDFLGLFVSQHLRRFETMSSEAIGLGGVAAAGAGSGAGAPDATSQPVFALLGLLFTYTFMQPDIEALSSCLDIWETFLDRLLEPQEGSSLQSAQEAAAPYAGGLLAFVEALLQKVLFRHNAPELLSLDDDEVEGDAQSEWDTFLSSCVSIIGKVGDLLPVQTLNITFPLLEEDLAKFMIREQLTSDASRALALTRDLRSHLRILARLSSVFLSSGSLFESTFPTILTLLKDKLLGLGTFLHNFALYRRSEQFNKLAVQLFTTLAAFAGWQAAALASTGPASGGGTSSTGGGLGGASTPAERTPEAAAAAELLFHQIKLAVSVLYTTDDSVLGLAVAPFLLALARAVRLPVLLEALAPQLLDLLTVASRDRYPAYAAPGAGDLPALARGIFQTSIEVRSAVFMAATTAIALPFQQMAAKDPAQAWDNRAALFAKVVLGDSGLTAPLQRAAAPGFHEQGLYKAPDVRALICEALSTLGACVSAVAAESKTSKAVVLEAVRPLLPSTINLLKIYASEYDVLERLIDFQLELFVAMRLDLGVEYVGEMVGVMLALLGGNQSFLQHLAGGTPASIDIINKLLQLLTLIVESGPRSSSLGALTGSIVQLVLGDLAPALFSDGARAAADHVAGRFFELVFALLDSRWHQLQPEATASESVSPGGQAFYRLLDLAQLPFKSSDIGIFRDNLARLGRLDQTRRLFSLPDQQVIRQCHAFAMQLMRVLNHRGHELLREDILALLFRIFSSVDMPTFAQSTIEAYLASMDALSEADRHGLLQGVGPLDMQGSFVDSIGQLLVDSKYLESLRTTSAASVVL